MVSNSLGPFLALASAARAASAGAGTAAETAPATGKTASGTTGTPGISSASATCRTSTFNGCDVASCSSETVAVYKRVVFHLLHNDFQAYTVLIQATLRTSNFLAM